MHKLIFILGIDALDYELVEKLSLKNLKQIEYSKIVVPIHKELEYPSSPEVWASFLTGESISKSFENSSIFINIILNVLGFFNINTYSGVGKKVKNLVKKLGFNAPIKFGSLNQKTFLDITNSKKINVPYYSFDHKTFDISYLFGKGELSLEQTVKEIKLIYESRKKQIFSEVDNIREEDIVFAFMHTADVLQHCAYLRVSEIELHYIDLNSYVSSLKRKLADSFGEVIFIIVSDHGFDLDKGTHSMKGFYSSNNHLIPKPEKITDFYGILLKIIQDRSKKYV